MEDQNDLSDVHELSMPAVDRLCVIYIAIDLEFPAERDGVSIIWNLLNLIHFMVRKRAFSNVTNILVHFVLGSSFIIIGIYVTVVTWGAYAKLGKDLYGLQAYGPHNIIALNGQTITVDPTNVASCPAFDSCSDQTRWLQSARTRGLIAVFGSILFDVAFLIHALFFLWSCNDAIFGTRGRTARIEEREEKERIRKFQADHPIPETSAENKSFDISAQPSPEVLQRAKLMDLPERNPDIGGRDHISGPVVTEHTSYALSENGQAFVPSSQRTFILRPASDSRESLSLAIFETTSSSMRPVSGLPTLPNTIVEEEFFDTTPPVPPVAAFSAPPSAVSSSHSMHSSRSRMSSRESLLGHVPGPGAARDSSQGRIVLSQGTDSSKSSRTSSRSSHSATTGYFGRPPSSLDYAQQPHPQYSYYRGDAGTRKTSSAGVSTMPPMRSIPMVYAQGDTRNTYSPEDIHKSRTVSGSSDRYKRVSASRDFVFTKRESISALPPVPKNRASQASMRSMKSTNSSRSRPAKLQRKSTLRNVQSSEELN